MEVRSDGPRSLHGNESRLMPPGIRPPTPPGADPYESGTLFHGPSFQLLRSLALAPGASSALLDAARGGRRAACCTRRSSTR